MFGNPSCTPLACMQCGCWLLCSLTPSPSVSLWSSFFFPTILGIVLTGMKTINFYTIRIPLKNFYLSFNIPFTHHFIFLILFKLQSLKLLLTIFLVLFYLFNIFTYAHFKISISFIFFKFASFYIFDFFYYFIILKTFLLFQF